MLGQNYVDEFAEVEVERGWEGFEVGLFEVLCAEFVFEGEELLAVGCGGEAGVVEWEEKRVDVGNPAEAWGFNSCAHGYSVSQLGADVGAVEDVGGVVFALLLARGFASGFELFEAGGVEWWLPIEVEDCFPCFVERREIGAHAGGVGVRLHVVDGESIEVAVGGVSWWREDWVGVVVDGGDGGYLVGEGWVDG